MNATDAPPPALGELARTLAPLQAYWMNVRGEIVPHAGGAWYSRADVDARIAQLVALAAGGAAGGLQQEHEGTTENVQPQEPLLKGDSPMEMGEFHNRDGWYFKRNADGSVRIQKRTPDAANTVEQTHTIPPNEWTSIIAHLAANGGAGGNYAAAEQFHAGTVR